MLSLQLEVSSVTTGTVYIYIFFFFFWLGFCFDSWPSLVAEMAWLPRGTWDLSCLTRQEEKGMIHVPALEVEFFF